MRGECLGGEGVMEEEGLFGRGRGCFGRVFFRDR